MIYTIKKYFLIIILAIGIVQCKDESIYLDSDSSLMFSTDTLFFDTILTSNSQIVASINQQFIIKNPYSKPIITKITLAGGEFSPFKLNVDGASGHLFSEIEIGAKDSIFVFAEVYKQQNNVNNPLFFKDSIIFETNGNIQNIKLIAYGQDAHYYYKDSSQIDLVWDDIDKPYVIYDFLRIKPNTKLTIKKGVRVFVAPYSNLIIEGSLKVEGTFENPIIFQGDRLTDDYKNVPGQWSGIVFLYPSHSNTIEHAIIKNASFGIAIDSFSSNGQANIIIKKTQFQTLSAVGIIGNQSTVLVENCTFTNIGQYALITGNGGNYILKHCTFNGYCDFSAKRNGTIGLTNRKRADDILRTILATYTLNFLASNCIFDSPDKESLDLDLEPNKYNLSIDHSLIKTEISAFSDVNLVNILNKSPKFISNTKYDMDLDTLSFAKNIGIIQSPPINSDIKNRNRTDNKPDAGAFESQK